MSSLFANRRAQRLRNEELNQRRELAISQRESKRDREFGATARAAKEQYQQSEAQHATDRTAEKAERYNMREVSRCVVW